MKIQFLCGCQTANVEGLENLLTMSSVTNDEEGMLICAIHRQRRVGWRSVGRDHSRDRLTPLENEALALWGIEMPRPPVTGLHTVEDRRDNRDAEKVYYKSLQGRPAKDAAFRASQVTDREITDEQRESVRARLDLQDRTGWPTLDPLGYRDADVQQTNGHVTI